MGQLLIAKTLEHTLIDSGTRHYFVSTNFITELKRTLIMNSVFSIALLLDEVILTREWLIVVPHKDQ